MTIVISSDREYDTDNDCGGFEDWESLDEVPDEITDSYWEFCQWCWGGEESKSDGKCRRISKDWQVTPPYSSYECKELEKDYIKPCRKSSTLINTDPDKYFDDIGYDRKNGIIKQSCLGYFKKLDEKTSFWHSEMEEDDKMNSAWNQCVEYGLTFDMLLDSSLEDLQEIVENEEVAKKLLAICAESQKEHPMAEKNNRLLLQSKMRKVNKEAKELLPPTWKYDEELVEKIILDNQITEIENLTAELLNLKPVQKKIWNNKIHNLNK